MAEEKGTDFVTTLNRMIKTNKRYVCWTSYNHRSLLVACCADLYLFDRWLLQERNRPTDTGEIL